MGLGRRRLDRALRRQKSGRRDRDRLLVLRGDDVEADEELVPDEDHAEGRRDHDPGPDERQQDAQQHHRSRAPVDERGVVDLTRDLVEEPDHDPHDERQRERDVGEDQSPRAVRQGEVADH